jgi:cobalt/nickel transport system permease protein
MASVDQNPYGTCACSTPGKGRTLEGIARGLSRLFEQALDAENLAARPGLLQSLDPRAKVVAAILLIGSVVAVHSLTALAALFLLAIVLALTSSVPIGRLARQVWLGVLVFTGLIALPAPFIVAGNTLVTVPYVGWPVSEQGLRSAAFLMGRAQVSATLALLLVLTTPWTHVLKALRAIGVPVAIVAILGMTHRFIFLLVSTASQMFEARHSRALAPMAGRERRRIVIATAGVLLAKTISLAGETHLAMLARGYTGEVRLIGDFRFRPRDAVAMLAAAALLALLLWSQR